MSANLKYIIVDDDPFNNTIYSMVIKSAMSGADIKTFTIPEEGLAFIKNRYIKSPTILFLDINMPTLTGWEFLEEYEKFSEEVKKKIRIYILSSSVNQRDVHKANENKYVEGFISKPLNSETVICISEQEF
jgi:response regulator RpfG family c-di-GMP phosphodiesterase